jgi:hypothetical protein
MDMRSIEIELDGKAQLTEGAKRLVIRSRN